MKKELTKIETQDFSRAVNRQRRMKELQHQIRELSECGNVGIVMDELERIRKEVVKLSVIEKVKNATKKMETVYQITHYGKVYDCYNTQEEAEKGLKTDPLMVDGYDVTEEAVIKEVINPDCSKCYNYIKCDGGCPGLGEKFEK